MHNGRDESAQDLLILFGPPGVGKNFVGTVLQEDFQFHFYDADDDLSPAMLAAIKNQQTFTEEMRSEFYTQVCTKIKNLQQQHPKLVVAQALAKEINRKQMLKVFPNLRFIYVIAEIALTNQRIQQRNDWVSIEYAQKIRAIFEAPQIKHLILVNNSNRAAVKQQLHRFKL